MYDYDASGIITVVARANSQIEALAIVANHLPDDVSISVITEADPIILYADQTYKVIRDNDPAYIVTR